MSKLRAEKLQALIKQELSNMLIRDVKDPRVKFVTITGVEVSNDLSYAKVYVSLYGSEEQQAQAWKGLQHGLGYFRTEIAKRIDLRVAPQLSFHKDTSMEYSAHIESLLHELKKEEQHE
ncbi:30S ribosome-binding factor RbfA [Acidaminococcus timonensis]|uniref:30S ribosome-binding factor RbfA n=1 Tax=Acidaminococcus timonensis TaxID=1871002 RepID=UPI0026EFCE8D|nr:30S ribosome-binding factor RbfA [Acidaminococcus timonensis]